MGESDEEKGIKKFEKGVLEENEGRCGWEDG